MTIHVLVVDEDPEVLEITQTFLDRQESLSVDTEDDPVAAVDRVVDEGFDAVVSDLTMPGLDGLELCLELRDRGVDVPVLIFTGRDATAIEGKAGADCVEALIRKGAGTAQYEDLGMHIREAV